MNFKALKYGLVLTLPAVVAVAFIQHGWWVFLPLLYAFGFIPALELMAGADARNLDRAEAELRKADSLYDWMLYLTVPVQYGFLLWFFLTIGSTDIFSTEWFGRVSAMGLMCGTIGINVAHELGHRQKTHEIFMAKSLLLTSLYMHFFVEHNYGHHRNVSTPEDPSSARKGENLYVFIIRSMVFSLISAWNIEAKRLRRTNTSPFSLENRTLAMWMIQLAAIVLVGAMFGWEVLIAFLLAALMGGSLLETINYIEHYGLSRNKVSEFRYEDVRPEHSWNSNHIIGRLLLFELSRHSDHHYDASKKYQILDNYDHAPQMPTGYPGMMLLAAVPPLWFAVMNPRIEQGGFGLSS
jgi:alkane 1-monooxygenase